MKDCYNLGAVDRTLHAGDPVRIRLKAPPKGPAKLLLRWSKLHQLVFTRGVHVVVRKHSTGYTYKGHYDRVYYPFLKVILPLQTQAVETSANSFEDRMNADSNEESDRKPTLKHVTRIGRISRPTRLSKFDFYFLSPPVGTSLFL